MSRPWTTDEDNKLREMYERADTSMQKIRDALHRRTDDIHDRAAKHGLVRPARPARANGPPMVPKKPSTASMDCESPFVLAQSVTTLRRHGFAPVHAQRVSDSSTRKTGLWVVGKEVMTPDALVALATKYDCL
jgi:hypothetical protein